MLLDYLSPLPPVRSGISDYSIDLLPHLAARAEVRVLRLPGQPVDPEVEARWHPVPAAEIGAGARLPLYQMGNNPYHDGVWDLGLERPGVLTLHDLVLHHLLTHRTLGHGDFEGYRRGLTADHGWIGEAACRPRYWRLEDDASLFSLPAHRTLLRRQRGVLVHNRWAATKIREDDREIRVATVPMGIPLPPPLPAGAGLALRRRWGIPDTAPLLGSFGFQTPIKRTASVIHALADPRLAGAHLVIAGELSPNLDFDPLVRKLGVADRVHVVGFLPYEDFEAAIAAVDLTLNLRYPTAGETSASLLRIFALGRPAVVSDYAQFAELPDAVALKVPLGDGEIPALAAAISELLGAPEYLAEMGRAARRYVAREHRLEGAAEAILAACQEWAEAPPPDLASRLEGSHLAGSHLPGSSLAGPPTSLVRSRLPGTIRVEGGDSPWPEGERRRLTVHLRNEGPARWLAAARGPGGMALEVRLESSCTEPVRPWLPLRRDLAGGEEARIDLSLRRPPGPARLHLALRVLDAPEAETARWVGPLPRDPGAATTLPAPCSGE